MDNDRPVVKRATQSYEGKGLRQRCTVGGMDSMGNMPIDSMQESIIDHSRGVSIGYTQPA